LEAVIEEYGAPAWRAAWIATKTPQLISDSIDAHVAIFFLKYPPAPTHHNTPHAHARQIKPSKTEPRVIFFIL
ncbi:hypothetical protein ACVGV9_20875, partial [Enterobacter hormaechei]